MGEGMRKSPEAIRAMLEELDNAESDSPHKAERRSQRFAYRVESITVSIGRRDEVQQLEVSSRNISAEGVGFLLGKFVYPGTACRVTLVTLQDVRLTAEAEICYCRYLEGTSNIYEAGARFLQPVDVGLFHAHAVRQRGLLIDDDPLMRKLIEVFLAERNVELDWAADGASGLQRALEQAYDIVLLDIGLPDMSGVEVARSLREAGAGVPIVAVTANDDPQTRAEALAAGCGAWLVKPVTREGLVQVLESVGREPVASSLVHDKGMGVVIDTFVDMLPQTTGTLERAYMEGDVAALERMARMLKGQAGSCGFAAITTAAKELEALSRGGGDHVAVRAKLTELVAWCRAAQPARLGGPLN